MNWQSMYIFFKARNRRFFVKIISLGRSKTKEYFLTCMRHMTFKFANYEKIYWFEYLWTELLLSVVLLLRNTVLLKQCFAKHSYNKNWIVTQVCRNTFWILSGYTNVSQQVFCCHTSVSQQVFFCHTSVSQQVFFCHISVSQQVFFCHISVSQQVFFCHISVSQQVFFCHTNVSRCWKTTDVT
jgi:hypothetical protein